MMDRIENARFTHQFNQPVTAMEIIPRGKSDVLRVHLQDGTWSDLDPKSGVALVKGDA